ncbi:hypothetical protein PanWU01x14_223600, partial [Parasponia andersonii]
VPGANQGLDTVVKVEVGANEIRGGVKKTGHIGVVLGLGDEGRGGGCGAEAWCRGTLVAATLGRGEGELGPATFNKQAKYSHLKSI